MISVIVPVYKVEKYLDKCVQSILTQTYTDFELLLIDDGSPDKCPQMCDDYAERDKRVKVVHKNNGGLSDARNVGIEQALGDWVTFIDSDDYISSDYLEELWRLINQYDVEISVTGLCTFYDGDVPKENRNVQEYCYTGLEALEKMLYQNTLDSSACAMLLPIEVAKSNPFPVGKYHEDEFTTYKYYAEVKRVAVTTKSQYFYLQRKGSIMHTFGQASMDELDAADNYVAVCKEMYPDIVDAAYSKKFSDYCQVLLSTKNLRKVQPDIYSRIMSFLKETRHKIAKDKKCRKKNIIAARLLLFGSRPLLWVNAIKNKIGS